MKLLDKFKKALEDRVSLMLDKCYLVAIGGGYSKDKDTFLIAVRDLLDEEGRKGDADAGD